MTTAWRLGTLRIGPPRSLPPVVKLGGSLLGIHGWPALVGDLVAGLPGAVLVVGGGSLVDGLRRIDQAAPRPPQLMHDLAIDALALTARLVADALALPVVTEAGGGGVLDPARWLEVTGHAARLEAGWHVTSDSIAAVVATATGRGLLLAKRVPPPGEATDLERLAAAGWVDPCFPGAAAGVTAITWAAPA